MEAPIQARQTNRSHGVANFRLRSLMVKLHAYNVVALDLGKMLVRIQPEVKGFWAGSLNSEALDS